MAVTIKDIAKIAGVSYSTVSRSLNGSHLVAEKTKEQIKTIAAELGFEFNSNARSLSTHRKGTIGIIYPESFEDFDVNLYYSSLHNQIRKSLEMEEFDLIIAFPRNRYSGHNNIDRLVKSEKVDGLIIVNPALDDADMKALRMMEENEIPVVFLHHYPNDSYLSQKSDIICTNHFKGGYMATEHLIKRGHNRIISICAAEKWDEFINRTEGYKAALKDHNIKFNTNMLIYGDRSFQSGYKAVMTHKELLTGASAIFAQTDLMALGAIEALKFLKVRVPDDIAVVGYDDIELAVFFRPYLTTIHQPREKIAVIACEMLINQIKYRSDSEYRSDPRKEIIVDPMLIVRESCGSDS